MKRPGILIVLILGLVFLNNLSIGKTKTQDSPLITYTFYELGYRMTRPWYNSNSHELEVNCTGSSIYSAVVHMHITAEDSFYFFRINNGPQLAGGGPGGNFFSGWEERYIHPGYFRNGTNTLQIGFENYPLSDQTSTTSKYTSILEDSYIEIFDATALPLAIEWQGYEFNETDLTFNIQVIEKLTRLPVNTTSVIIRGSGENVTGNTLGNGIYKINIPLPHQTVNLTLVIEGESYETLITTLDLSVLVSENFKSKNDISAIILGVIIGFLITVIGGIILNHYYHKKKKQPKVEWTTKKEEKSSHFVPHSSSTTSLKGRGTFQLKTTIKECPICRKNLVEDDKIAICPGCNNRFHWGHYGEWIRQNGRCPVCQAEVVLE